LRTGATINNGGQETLGIDLAVLHKIGGKWLIVAHEAAASDPATAVQRLDIGPGK
jgi:hypothetical protein